MKTQHLMSQQTPINNSVISRVQLWDQERIRLGLHSQNKRERVYPRQGRVRIVSWGTQNRCQAV